MGLFEDFVNEGLISSDSLPKLDDRLPQNLKIGDQTAGEVPIGATQPTQMQQSPNAPGTPSAGASMGGVPDAGALPDAGDSEDPTDTGDEEAGETGDSENSTDDSGEVDQGAEPDDNAEPDSEPEPKDSDEEPAKESVESDFEPSSAALKMTEYFLKEMLSNLKEGDSEKKSAIKNALEAITKLNFSSKDPLNAAKEPSNTEESSSEPMHPHVAVAARYLAWANNKGHTKDMMKAKLQNIYVGAEEKIDTLIDELPDETDKDSVMKMITKIGLGDQKFIRKD